MIIFFSGSIGRLPVGGHAWIDMQYLEGLLALGHEVYYLEECGPESWVYNWETEQLTTDLSYPADYVRSCLEPLGLAGRWAYRAGEQSEGMSAEEVKEVCSRADLLLIRAVPLALWRPEYDLPRRRAFIDADPGFTQISLAQARGRSRLARTVARCEHVFTIGQRIGVPDCPVPSAGRRWLKTVPPVSMPHWPFAPDPSGGPATDFTTVMQWRGFREAEYKGVYYGQKNKEFLRFMDLPRLTKQPFRLALTGARPGRFVRHGWEVEEGWVASRTPCSYREFIQGSRAEFSVAKHGYVLMRSGWFSDRSVCYLASGRPALVEDTGLGDWLPTGEGLLTFRDMGEALAGVEAINSDYDRHRKAARRVAEDNFDAAKVLPPLIGAAMG
ncbi:MAG: glycosyltransferase [Chloroflexia bacterium]